MRITDARARRYLEGLTARQVATNLVDNRNPVQDPQDFPYAAIGQVLAAFPNGDTLVSSGFLIQSQYVATAGHAIFNAAAGGPATSVRFAPGRFDDSFPYGTFDVVPPNLFVAPGFQSGTATDYAMLNLQTDLAMIIGGNIPLVSLSDDDLNGLGDFQITGYPNDVGGGDQMWTAEGTLSGFTDSFVFTETAFATAGESGGPAWTFFDAMNEFGAFGIFIGSNPDGMTSIRVTAAIVQQYSTWMNG